MVLFNHATREMTAKIVYYGPGLCGKTTNLMVIFDKLDPKSKGKMLSLATKTDRTLFFDLLPVDIGKVGNFNLKIQLYTVPGQVFYNETRKLVLRGADAVVFVQSLHHVPPEHMDAALLECQAHPNTDGAGAMDRHSLAGLNNFAPSWHLKQDCVGLYLTVGPGGANAEVQAGGAVQTPQECSRGR